MTTPAEHLIAVLRDVASRHATAAQHSPWFGAYRGPTPDEVAEQIADRRVAAALEDVASELALALGVQG